MTFKKFKAYKSVKFITNRYVVILSVFIVWMVFFDENSYLVHREFNKEIDELEIANGFYKKKIKEDKKTIENLQDSLALEKFAREQYLMKKPNEDIFVVVYEDDE